MKKFRHFVELSSYTRQVKENGEKKDVMYVFPSYRATANDIMKKGGKFYAVLDRSTNMWSQNESDVHRIIDQDIRDYIQKNFPKDNWGKNRTPSGIEVRGSYIDNSESGRLKELNVWLSNLPANHNYVQLDTELTFKSTDVKPEMYRSKRLPYDVEEGSIEAYERLMSVLYSPENREKLEWAVGSVLAGDSKTIDKLIVIYSYPGFGKSTILNIIKKLFTGYWTVFQADALVSNTNQFASAAFKDNPLVAIHADGSLKKIESPIINELVSHEEVLINEKNKAQYVITSNAMLFVATNDLVDLHDTKVGITRRLLDVYPTMQKLPVTEYRQVVKQIDFEISAIAYRCLGVYKALGKEYYEGYMPIEMIKKTNYLQNFFNDKLEEFSKQEYFVRDTLYLQFCTYCTDSGLGYAPKRIAFGEQLREYFDEYYDRKRIDGVQQRHVYMGLKIHKILGMKQTPNETKPSTWIKLHGDDERSELDRLYSDVPAQYASEKTGKPVLKWPDVTTKLKDLNPRKLHWFILPPEIIKIDFDKRGPNGEKDLEENIKAASSFPPTYCEVSQSGGGLHLYYIYAGDVHELSHLYADGVEIKVSIGDNGGVMPHRRLLTLHNDLPISTLTYGLPPKEVKKKVVNEEVVTTERSLRATIKKCLAKEVHADTTSNIHFIDYILKEAYNSGVKYDVSDMFTDIYMFAAGATNQSEHCLDVVRNLKLASEDAKANVVEVGSSSKEDEGPIIFYDIEVFPNLMILCWMYDKDDAPVNVMINPTADELMTLFGFGSSVKPRMIGFNNRGYDDHIVYGVITGDSILERYNRSQRIINGDAKTSNAAKFREAYTLSYADVYDFASEKMSLKKWEIKLGIHHQELGLDWDKPVSESMWETVGDYCKNDVIATRAVFKACEGDYITRQALADISGLKVINTNRQHITKILLGDDKQADHIYTDLATGVAYDITGMPVPLDPNVINEFPGYEFKKDEKTGKMVNWYRGTDVGRGGYVYAEPGMYTNVALLDVGNMHGASIDKLNKFGRHTERYRTIRNARMAIKHGDYITASKLLDGKLDKYLTSDEMAGRIEKALKLVLNSTYGIAAATFDNPLRDVRDKNNIIALRGALFMRTLQDEVQSRGFKVIHIKTDSIKVPDATPEIIQFIMEFGEKYGYAFEHEATYERICLVNDAVYVAKYDANGIRNKGGKHAGEWTATGAEFQHPYIFKTLFSHEPIIFSDKCETKSCTSALVLDFNENLPEGEHDYRFVGKVGSFCPIKAGCGGGILYRKQNDKYYAATGTTGYRWMEAELVRAVGKEFVLDNSYYRKLVDSAIAHINEFGDFEWFVNGDIGSEHYEFSVA